MASGSCWADTLLGDEDKCIPEEEVERKLEEHAMAKKRLLAKEAEHLVKQFTMQMDREVLEREARLDEQTCGQILALHREAADQRTQLEQKAHALTRMLERERTNFHNDTEELKRMVAEEASVQREQDRAQRDRREMTRSGKGGRPYMIADEEEAFSETDMYRRILKLSFLNTIQRRHIRQHQKNIEVFEQAFATIKSSTGISDIEEIVKIFIGLEQRNFSLLTYVNTLNREIEQFEKHHSIACLDLEQIQQGLRVLVLKVVLEFLNGALGISILVP